MAKPRHRVFAPLEYRDGVGSLRFTAFSIPPNGVDLSLDALYGEAAPDQSPVARRVAMRFASHKARTVFLPAAGYHSGIIASRGALTERFALNYDVELRRKRGFPADGVALGHGQGFVMSTRGCALLTAFDPAGNLIAAHASLTSLLGNFRTNSAQDIDGVLHAIARTLCAAGSDPAHASLRILFAAHPTEFAYPLDHPLYGIDNRELYIRLSNRFGEDAAMDRHTGAINLAAIATALAEELGFDSVCDAHFLRTEDGFALTGDGRNLVGVACL